MSTVVQSTYKLRSRSSSAASASLSTSAVSAAILSLCCEPKKCADQGNPIGLVVLPLLFTKPIVPETGHCLVLSRRVASRFGDLSPEEVSDLWRTAQFISSPLQKHYAADALTFAIQDGSAAGQTVPHVHIHVMPRKNGDFKPNDQVYDELEKLDMSRTLKVDADEHRKARSFEEMAAEARQLRRLYESPVPIPFDPL